MRLKIIFTPIAFLVVVVVSIWYIWPTIQEINIKRNEVSKAVDDLNRTRDKKNNVDILKTILDNNKEKEDYILSYLPSVRSDERTTDAINYIADDSGISLIKLTLEEGKGNVLAQIPNNASDNQIDDPNVRFVTVKANLLGKYDNIKMFLKQIYSAGILNKTNSLAISKKEISSEEGNQSDSDVLSVSIAMGFGHMESVNAESGDYSNIFSKNNFDFSKEIKLHDLMTKNVPVLNEGQKGKSNPFLQ
ncbi:MAG: hypothetical protein WC906_03580 [Parcubacteria group bacterium]|jgi:hypothetical protein